MNSFVFKDSEFPSSAETTLNNLLGDVPVICNFKTAISRIQMLWPSPIILVDSLQLRTEEQIVTNKHWGWFLKPFRVFLLSAKQYLRKWKLRAPLVKSFHYQSSIIQLR